MSTPDDIEALIALGKRHDALYTEWAHLLAELHQQKAISLEMEKHRDDIVRAFAGMRAIVAQEIGRRVLSVERETE